MRGQSLFSLFRGKKFVHFLSYLLTHKIIILKARIFSLFPKNLLTSRKKSTCPANLARPIKKNTQKGEKYACVGVMTCHVVPCNQSIPCKKPTESLFRSSLKASSESALHLKKRRKSLPKKVAAQPPTFIITWMMPPLIGIFPSILKRKSRPQKPCGKTLDSCFSLHHIA